MTQTRDHERPGTREWPSEAIRRIEADATRSADTHLHTFPLPPEWGIDLYLKDESVHPTGSLKHRLARSLFLYGLCSGWIREGTRIVEASSGSTAVSEAYFARFLGLPFTAVMPASTSPEKIALIEAEGGSCHLVDDPTTVYETARRLATECDGHYIDQFTYAERAVDWLGNNNIAESIFEQMAMERHPDQHALDRALIVRSQPPAPVSPPRGLALRAPGVAPGGQKPPQRERVERAERRHPAHVPAIGRVAELELGGRRRRLVRVLYAERGGQISEPAAQVGRGDGGDAALQGKRGRMAA